MMIRTPAIPFKSRTFSFLLCCIAALLCIGIIALPVAAAEPAETTTVTLPADADSYIRWGEAYYDSNFGTSTVVSTRIESLAGSYWGRGLIRFDLSSVPKGSMVESATLHAYKSSYTLTPDIAAFRITNPWTETGVTWGNWDSNASISPAGPTAVAATTAAKEWVSWDVTDDVRAYVDGTSPNYGWMLNITGDTARPASTLKAVFNSRENSASTPYLSVTYSTVSSPVPEFPTMAFPVLVIGVLAFVLISYRRK